MGVVGAWPFIRKKGYEPTLAHPDSARFKPTNEGPFRHTDVLGCYFTTIRRAYSCNDEAKAQSIVETAIRKHAAPTNSALYIDGQPSQEKRATNLRRQEIRDKAVKQAELDIICLEDRVNAKQKMRKQVYFSAKKNLEKAFSWSLDSKLGLVEFLRSNGWNVVECDTEADVMIARMSISSDIVVSRDSDFLFYHNVETLWRPISNSKLFVYNIPQVLDALQVNKDQWTALAVVSKNDYTANINSLGLHSNHGIIKNLEGTDPAHIVDQYLASPEVQLKNADGQTFCESLRVFVQNQQTVLVSETSSLISSEATYPSLRARLFRLKEQYSAIVQSRQEDTDRLKSQSSGSPRHKSCQTFNRYRTIDRPEVKGATDHHQKTEDEECVVSKLSVDTGESPVRAITAASSLPSATTISTTTTKHAEKTRKGPCHRPRYVWKTRSRQIRHEPPASMKQYKLKPWKKVPEQPSGSDVVEKEEEEEKEEEKEETKRNREDISDMDKFGLLRCFEYEHPIVTLNVGTLNANVRRALAEDSIPPNEATTSKAAKPGSLNPETVIDHLNEAVETAATVKRKLQRLVGGFIRLIFSRGAFEASDRQILDHLSPRTETDAKGSSAIKSKGKKKTKCGYDHVGFIGMLARYLHSGNPPGNSNIGNDVKQFISRAQDLGLLSKQVWQPTRNVMKFPAVTVTRSITSDLVA